MRTLSSGLRTSNAVATTPVLYRVTAFIEGAPKIEMKHLIFTFYC